MTDPTIDHRVTPVILDALLRAHLHIQKFVLTGDDTYLLYYGEALRDLYFHNTPDDRTYLAHLNDFFGQGLDFYGSAAADLIPNLREIEKKHGL